MVNLSLKLCNGTLNFKGRSLNFLFKLNFCEILKSTGKDILKSSFRNEYMNKNILHNELPC